MLNVKKTGMRVIRFNTEMSVSNFEEYVSEREVNSIINFEETFFIFDIINFFKIRNFVFINIFKFIDNKFFGKINIFEVR
jgi:hypothetical protein